MSSPTKQSVSGVIYALAAFLSWGVLPIYWKTLEAVPALQIMLNRVVWSLVFLVILISVRKDWGTFRSVCRQKRSLGILFSSSVLIALNWLLYIWAVNSERIVEASLGYYINPLVTVLLGVVFLKERPTSGQLVAIIIAATGVIYSVEQLGEFPWVATGLALTFALYGLMRKIVSVESVMGLTVETALLTPFAAGILLWFGTRGSLMLGREPPMDVLLIGAGVVTALPLIWFTCGTRRLQLSTVGFLQYVAPTTQLLIGVCMFHEPFPKEQLITFGFIWVALAIYSIDAFVKQRGISSRAQADGTTNGN